MPTVFWVGPYRFFFYSGDGGEPPHVHVERDADMAKFWLAPVRLASSGGFRRPELRDIERLVNERRTALQEAWDEHFGG
jgi:hypothetical protein